MAITSVGYAGTVSDEQWAKMVARVGSAFYSVDDFASFRVTAAAGTRMIQVATGGASGNGIYDLSSTVVTRPLDSVPSGIRWDLVVLRRTWATKTSDIIVIPGGSTKALPARSTTPGTIDDQPLALVRVAADSTAIQEVVDLRCAVHNGGAIAWDDLARSYLNQLGTDLLIGTTSWRRVTNASGSADWVGTPDTGWVGVPIATAKKWVSVVNYALQVRRIGSVCHLRGAVRANAGADFSTLATVADDFRPTANTPLGATVMSPTPIVAELFLQPTGVIWISQDYRTAGSLPVGAVVMLHGTWLVG